MPSETFTGSDGSTATVTTTGVTGTSYAPPTAADLAVQARELQKQAVEQAEQDVKYAEQAVRDTVQAAAIAKTALQAKRSILRAIKTGVKAQKPAAEKQVRKPRGASKTAVAGALASNDAATTLTN